MKHLKLAFLTLFLFYLNGIRAQQNHFIYIQTENKQPFYVKLDSKIYSSSASGYLVMSKLKDATYNLAIGFPKSEWTEQNMICSIDKSDKGYLLKNFGEKGWGLFNLQTLDVVLANGKEKVNSVEVENKTDAFSNMLSNVVNDSTIRQTEMVKEEVKKTPVVEEEKTLPVAATEKEPVQEKMQVNPANDESKTDEAKEGKTNTALTKEIEKTEITKDQASFISGNRPSIIRTLFNKNAEGTEMVFIDEANGTRDTIRVFIPTVKNSAPVVEEKPKEIEKPKEESKKSATVKQEEKTRDTRFLEIELPNPAKKPEENKPVENRVMENTGIAKTETNDQVKQVEPAIQQAPMINSDCKNFASDEDFLKLRKKLAGGDNDDAMITIAKKIFKTKCFTVEQVKNLSVLFLKDAGKYAFFDMAYPFVSDSHKFSTLQNQLSETYYINRFQVMIRH